MSRSGVRRVVGRLPGSLVLPVLASLLASACGTVETAREIAPAGLQTAPVIQRETRVYREWVGTLDGYFTAEIRPQVEGRLLGRIYREGSFVKRGDVLFEIGPPEVPPDLGRAIGAARTKVVAPIDGIAGVSRVRDGDRVDARSILTTVSTVEWIKVFFYADRREYRGWTKRRDHAGRHPAAHPHDRALFEMILPNGTLYAHRGHLLPAGRGADATDGTIALTAVFPNPSRLLRPGRIARLRAAVDVSERTLLVPERAVFRQQGRPHVAVVGPDSTVGLRAVQAGERVGALRLIERGLGPGDRVIVDGLDRDRTGTADPSAAGAW
jgi:multidrug efflux pump subunit AcrA (membrane-fusion protein)